jgi:glucosamine kinase
VCYTSCRNDIAIPAVESRGLAVNFGRKDPVNNFESVLAIDLGQSGSRVLLPNGSRVKLEQFYEPKTDLVFVVEQILEKIEDTKADLVLLSLTGLNGRVHSIEKFGAVAKQYTNCNIVAVCDDGLAWNLGALAGEDGAIIAAGGGAVAVARHGENFAHVDGMGYELGDQGSAYWIGIESLRLAIKAKEGRAEKTQLVDIAEDYFGDILELPHKKLTPIELHSKCIQFAEKTFSLINKDEQLTNILTCAVEELANSATAVAQNVNLTEAKISPVGGLFNNPWFADLFKQKVLEINNRNQIVVPKGDALDGLMLIPQQLMGINNKLIGWCKF